MFDFESDVFGAAPSYGREGGSFNSLPQSLRNRVWAQANQNWNRAGLPGVRETPILQAAGLPIGPAMMWAPERMPTDQKWWDRQGFGSPVTPAQFPSRWVGVHPQTGGAMREGLVRGQRGFSFADVNRVAPDMRTQPVRWFGGQPLYPSNWSPGRVSFEQAIRNPFPTPMR